MDVQTNETRVNDHGPYYGLRHKPTGILMPAFKGHAGGTYVDPWQRSTHDGTPRLFRSPTAAKNALTWWARGMVRTSGGNGFDFEGDDIPVIRSVEPVKARDAADWEVVTLTILAR